MNESKKQRNEGFRHPNGKEPISITNDFTLADRAHLDLYKQHLHIQHRHSLFLHDGAEQNYAHVAFKYLYHQKQYIYSPLNWR